MSEDALAALRRWVASGATWQVRRLGPDGAEVDLVSCDGGETMGHLSSSDPDFVAHVSEVDPRP